MKKQQPEIHIGEFLSGIPLEQKLEKELGFWKRIKLDSYQLHRILCSDVAEIAKYCIGDDNSLARISDPWFGGVNKRNVFKYLYRVLFCKLNTKFISFLQNGAESDVVFFHLYTHRKDSNKNVLNVAKDNPGATIIWGNFSEGLFTDRIDFSPVQWFNRLVLLLRVFWRVQGSFEGNPLVRLYLSAKSVEYARWIQWVEGKLESLDFKYAVFYADWRGYENALCQMLQRRGVKTFAMQHGVYPANLGEKAVLGNIAFENFTADYFLCWGSYLKDRLSKELNLYDASRFVEVCHPCRNLYTDPSKWRNQVAPEHIWILGPQKRLEQANLEMTRICREVCERLDIKYSLKLHPSCMKSKYEAYLSGDPFCEDIVSTEKTVRDLCTGNVIFVSHNTSAYYEVLASGYPCILYVDDEFRDVPNLGLSFRNSSELVACVERIANDHRSVIGEMRKLTDYVFGVFTSNPAEFYISRVNADYA